MDVQIGPQLYENAPQELRSRLWVALLDNSTLATSVEHSAVSFVAHEFCRCDKMLHCKVTSAVCWVGHLNGNCMNGQW